MAFTKITSTNIAENTVAGYAEFANIANSLAPKITSIAITSNTYSVLDDTAVNVGGGFIVVTGTEFQSGVTVLIDTTPATAVSYVNNTTLRVQVPAKSAASYNLYVVNPDGGTGIKVAGITYSGTPTWVTASPLANVQSNTVFSNTFSATDAVSYANTTILPTGFNLLANGYYFGNISVGSSTTYSFDIQATDAENQESTKTFSLTALGLPPTYAVDVLVLGGGGGASFGGGGAGGMTFGPITVDRNTTYPITVGAGGQGISDRPSPSPSNTGPLTGSPSAAFGYTAFGGGFGAHAGNPVTGRGGDGANGGGGWRMFPSPFAAQPGGTGNQGYPGGAGASNPPIGTAAGGGGGAGGTGGSGTVSPTGSIGGNGGPGATWPIDGRSYAAGGGGVFNGGPGGSVNGTTPPTTSGGWGNGGQGPQAPGSPGLVSIAIPSSNYPGSAPPAASTSTPPAAPGKIILTYYSPGTYTA